jgi:hypothetical protein
MLSYLNYPQNYWSSIHFNNILAPTSWLSNWVNQSKYCMFFVSVPLALSKLLHATSSAKPGQASTAMSQSHNDLNMAALLQYACHFISLGTDPHTYTKEAWKKASGCITATSSELSQRILDRLALCSCSNCSAKINVIYLSHAQC